MEEMELMYMENNSKVCVEKIFIKQLIIPSQKL
jgi:hypothetical protein